jgi:integrase
MPDPTRFMTFREVRKVLRHLQFAKLLSDHGFLNLVIFRLSCCCGLRCKEIHGLRMSDLVLGGTRPCIVVRRDNTKGRIDKRRQRKVPLWWDSGTLKDLKDWVAYRQRIGAEASDPLVCSLYPITFGLPLSKDAIGMKWKTCVKILGPTRQKQVSIHGGRHTFASLSFDQGHSAVEVQEALGHSSINTTSIYLHAVPRDVGDTFPMPHGRVCSLE